MLRAIAAFAGICVLGGGTVPAVAQSLKGSSWSLTVQNREAQNHDYSYLRNRSHVDRFVDLGLLVPVRGNGDYELHEVSYPYARSEVRTFIERLAGQYRSACGEKLVVTSLVRPESMRLWNSSNRSVHPTGMAIDLRLSNRASCRQWLESTLISLERRGVVEATRERRPPHYHVAVFPRPYFQYLAALGVRPGDSKAEAGPLLADATGVGTAAAAPLAAGIVSHEVLRGETLWNLARDFGTSVKDIMSTNGLETSSIRPGQILRIPAAAAQATVQAAAEAVAAAAGAEPKRYTVSRGDSLWKIARRHDTTVASLKAANDLRTNSIKPGQVLSIPAR